MKSAAIGINKNYSCKNEYAPIKKVITAAPLYMQIEEAINETQKYYMKENIDRSEALRQHSNFIHVLRHEGIEVIELPVKKNLPEQIFTRDIGFVIKNKLFISTMAKNIRQTEVDIFKDWLEERGMDFKLCFSGIEGGDVVVDEDTLWIGCSQRTSFQAICSLEKEFPEHTIKTVQLEKNMLHLDCAFNIIGRDTAIIYPPAIDEASYHLMQCQYHLIEVTNEEQFNMGPNVLSIGNKTVISLPENKRLNHKLHEAGFEVIEVEFSEIIKSGGSFRCCTLPLLRG
ncbi:dimethylarginine dimethylaminohydrolase family protein [Virgibacillus oceani]